MKLLLVLLLTLFAVVATAAPQDLTNEDAPVEGPPPMRQGDCDDCDDFKDDCLKVCRL